MIPVTTESRPTGPGSVPETGAAIEVRHLRKTYRATVAVDDVSFSVRDGGADAIGQLLLYPFLFSAGLYFPRHSMPPVLRQISEWSPLGASVHALQGINALTIYPKVRHTPFPGRSHQRLDMRMPLRSARDDAGCESTAQAVIHLTGGRLIPAGGGVR